MRIEPSAFDTEMLGFRVGKVAVCGLSRQLVEELQTELRETNLDLVFVRDTQFPFERVGELPWTGLELADVKIALSKTELSVAAANTAGFNVTGDVGPADGPGLMPIVRPIARKSRFCRCFGEPSAFRLYDAWLQNVLARQAADWCFVSRRTGHGEPAGLIAVSRSGDSAEFTLVAIAEEYRGQGLLRMMSSHVFAFLRSQGVSLCTVRTQLSNRAALRAYQALGFVFDSTLVDLHLSGGR